MSLLTRKGKEIRKTQVFFAWTSFILGEILQFWSYIKTGRILLIENLYGGWWFGMILTALLGFFAVPVVLGLTKVFEEDKPVLARIIFYIFNFGIFFAPYATVFLTLLLFWPFVMYIDDAELQRDTKDSPNSYIYGFYFSQLVAIVLGNIFMHWSYARTKCDPIVTPFLNALGVHERLTGWLWISTGCLLINFICFVILFMDENISDKGQSWYHIVSIFTVLLFPAIGQVLMVAAHIFMITKKKSANNEKWIIGTMICLALIMAGMWVYGMVHLAQTQGWQALPLVEYVLEFWNAIK